MKFDPLNDGQSLVELVQHMGDDKMVVNAARVSFNNDVRDNLIALEQDAKTGAGILFKEQYERDSKLINYLARNKHSSPFQHCMVTFHIACPLFVYAQWRRHRTFNYTQINEVSRRYTSENIEFYMPKEFRSQSTDNKQASEGRLDPNENNNAWVEEAVNTAKLSYEILLENGVAREMARMVLPQNMYTRFYATMDLWNLYHFWSLRNDSHAQYEIRVYAEAIDDILGELFPVSWKALKGD